MALPGALHWRQLIGYATALLVALGAMALGYKVYHDEQGRREISRTIEDHARTHAGPIGVRDPDHVAAGARRLLGALPSLNELSDDSVRFVAMPSFGRRWFGISMSNTPSGVAVTLVVLDRGPHGDVISPEPAKHVEMPHVAYVTMVTKLDRLTDGWGGKDGVWLDGTSIGFERVRGDSVTSGLGNSPTHYRAIGNVMRDGLSPYLPEIAALDESWMTSTKANVR